MNHFKTVETNTEPSFIITNDVTTFGGVLDGSIVIGHYYYEGNDGEKAPRFTEESEGAISLSKDDILKLIAALKEFL